MNQISLSTPALLFPAISLLLLAYTNRFLALAKLVRDLNDKYQHDLSDPHFTKQVANLSLRLTLIRVMQSFGISSIFACLTSMLLFIFQKIDSAEIVFAGSIVLLMTAVGFSFTEIQISTRALRIELEK